MILWPRVIGLEPPPGYVRGHSHFCPPHIAVAGFQLLLLAKPRMVLPQKPRTIEAILRDPLGRS